MIRLQNIRLRFVSYLFFSVVILFSIISLRVLGQDFSVSQKNENSSVPTMTLAEAIELALYANRRLKSVEYGIESRKYALKSAEAEFEWKYAPTASAAASEDSKSAGGGVSAEKKFVSGPVATLNPEFVKRDSHDVAGDWEAKFGIELTIPLFRGLGTEINMDTVESAEFSLRSIQRSHYLTKVEIVIETVAAVYNIVEQQELVNLHQALTKRFQGHVLMAETREKAGLATPIDVYRAKIRLKDSQDSLSRAREALRNAKDRLKIVLAAPMEQAIHVAAPLAYPPPDLTIVQAVETAMHNRIELEQIDDEIKNAQRLSRLARHNLKPKLDLVGRYNRLAADDDITRAIRMDEDFWSVNLSTSMDWSRTSEKAAFQQSLLAVKTAELNRWSRIDGIKREVRQAFDSLEKTEERMRIREEQIAQANGKLALARTKFRHGMADNFNVIEAETELQGARADFLSAKIDHIVGIYRIRAAMGTLIGYKNENEWGGTP